MFLVVIVRGSSCFGARALGSLRFTVQRESSFLVDSRDRRIMCYRKKIKNSSDQNVIELKNKGYGFVSVCGTIVGDRKSSLIGWMGVRILTTYQVLCQEVLTLIRDLGDNAFFMQNDVLIHRAVATRTFLQKNRVRVLPFPALSSDLNAIELLWDILKLMVFGKAAAAPHKKCR